MKMKNRILALLLTLALVLSMVPVAFAADQVTVSLSTPAGVKEEKIPVGGTFTFPTAEDYEDYRFSCWTTEPVKATDGSDLDYIYFAGDTLEVEENRTFYALYAYKHSELDVPCFFWSDIMEDYTGDYALVGFDFDDYNGDYIYEAPLAMGKNGETLSVVDDLGATVDVDNYEFYTDNTDILFHFEMQDNGTYTLSNKNTGKYVSVSGKNMTFVNTPDAYAYWNIELYTVEGDYGDEYYEYIFNAKNPDLVMLYDDVEGVYKVFDNSEPYSGDAYPIDWFYISLYAYEDAIYMFTTEVENGKPVEPTEPTDPTNPTETEPTEPTEPEELPEGLVAIYNVASSVVMTTESNEYNGKAQLLPAAATLNGDKLTVATDKTALFRMENTDNGNVSFRTQDGKYLEADGTNLRFVATANENTEFVLEEAENGYCIRLANYVYVDGNGNEKSQYIEYYADKEVFTVYGMGANLDLFVFDFYAVEVEEEPEDPTVPTVPDEPDVPKPVEGAVAIYNVANSMIMTTEGNVYNGKEQLNPASAILNGDKLSTAASNPAQFYMTTENGVTTFQLTDGRYLEADGTNLRFVDAPNENTEFVLEPAEGGYYIRLANYVYVDKNGNEKPQYIEYYADKQVFTVYGMGADTTMYVFDFYALEGETTKPEDPEDPEIPDAPKPIEGTVAIYNPANGVIMTTAANVYNGKEQLNPASATLNGNKLATTDSNAAQFIMTTENGVTTFRLSDGRYLEADGTNLRFVDAPNENTEFVLEPTVGGYYIRLANYVYVDKNGNEKPQYIEYYADKQVFTVYGMGVDPTMYVFDFYGLEGETQPEVCEHKWDKGQVIVAPTCESEGVCLYSCELCGEVKEEVLEKLTCGADQFEDLNPNEWYHEGVDFMLNRGLMNGMSATEFRPNVTLNRAMVATVLYRLVGQPQVEGAADFTDVESGEWYTDAVAWAQAEGIVTGYTDHSFRPFKEISRQEMAVMLARYAKSTGASTDSDVDLSIYPDEKQVDTWAKEAIAWAVDNGLINGVLTGGVSYLKPRDNATRAQFATIIMRFLTKN